MVTESALREVPTVDPMVRVHEYLDSMLAHEPDTPRQSSIAPNDSVSAVQMPPYDVIRTPTQPKQPPVPVAGVVTTQGRLTLKPCLGPMDRAKLKYGLFSKGKTSRRPSLLIEPDHHPVDQYEALKTPPTEGLFRNPPPATMNEFDVQKTPPGSNHWVEQHQRLQRTPTAESPALMPAIPSHFSPAHPALTVHNSITIEPKQPHADEYLADVCVQEEVLLRRISALLSTAEADSIPIDAPYPDTANHSYVHEYYDCAYDGTMELDHEYHQNQSSIDAYDYNPQLYDFDDTDDIQFSDNDNLFNSDPMDPYDFAPFDPPQRTLLRADTGLNANEVQLTAGTIWRRRPLH